MNTQAFEQFDVMDNEALSAVKGGGRGWNCAAGIALGAGQGYMATAGVQHFLVHMLLALVPLGLLLEESEELLIPVVSNLIFKEAEKDTNTEILIFLLPLFILH